MVIAFRVHLAIAPRRGLTAKTIPETGIYNRFMAATITGPLDLTGLRRRKRRRASVK